MATDFLLAGYQAIKALLLADTTLNSAAVVRRFVWFDTDDTRPEPEKRIPAKQPGDVAELKLDWDSLTDTQRTQTRTIGNTQPGSTCPFIEEETHEYLITVTVDDVRITKISAILSHVRRILRAGSTVTVGGGGTAFVGRITARNNKTIQAEARGRYRRVATLRVPLSIRYRGNLQTT